MGMTQVSFLALASHADVLRGSSRRSAHFTGQERVTNP